MIPIPTLIYFFICCVSFLTWKRNSHCILLIRAFSNLIFNNLSRVSSSKSYKTVSLIVNVSLSLQHSETVNNSHILFILSCWRKFIDISELSESYFEDFENTAFSLLMS